MKPPRKPAAKNSASAQATGKTVADLVHTEATRKNIPTVEHQSVMPPHEQAPRQVAYPRANAQWLGQLCALHDCGQPPPAARPPLNRDLDPQLIWRGKDQQDWADLVVNAPPLYIQEKVKPKALIDDLRQQSQATAAPTEAQTDFFGDFNGLPEGAERTDFYQHDGHWQNRMILGDSLQVMASLAEREGLRGKVQCIYFDPPYGIKFNSNFQWSTTSRDVKDGHAAHITREPEQVKAFRDTWRDGIHSYLSYLRDRLTVARDLLAESGSIFVQIGDENVHRVRAVMDEVFGEGNFCAEIIFRKTARTSSNLLPTENDFILWYARRKEMTKFRPLFRRKDISELKSYKYLVSDDTISARFASDEEKSDGRVMPDGWRLAQMSFCVSGDAGKLEDRIFNFRGKDYDCGAHRHWKTTNPNGLGNLGKSQRLFGLGTQLNFIRYFDDFSVESYSTQWTDTGSAGFSNSDPKVYVVQTDSLVIQRCLLMSTDPGDLVLDPTCGSGTTATVAEQWGRRWITIDTSRVALALARARIMGARYPYYLLADSKEGQAKEAELAQRAPSTQPVYGNIAHGFVCQRVPHITLKSIANNADIDRIWDEYQQQLEPLRAQLNKALTTNWQEWEIPREADETWAAAAKKLHADWWQLRIERQRAIDASIAARAEYETLYDQPYEDKKRVRVAGPFTVESLSPHRTPAIDENDELIDPVAETRAAYGQDFASVILANLKTAGVQQKDKEGKIEFTALTPWPGHYICAEGHYLETDTPKRAGILIGPEFGTVSKVDLVEAAREAGDAGFDVLIACAFNYDASATDFGKLGRIHILKARINADLHMAEDLKNTGQGNLFVIFGEPDVEVLDTRGNSLRRYEAQRDSIELPAGEELLVRIKGVDVFMPSTGEIRSDNPDDIACWFLDTDYNGESFFVRHAYFLGANDPYKALKTTLKADIDADAWASLHSDTSRPFPKPSTGRFAVKVINHLGDEVMKVFKVD